MSRLRAAFLAVNPEAKAEAAIALDPGERDPGEGPWPERPGRPERPLLVPARDVPRRSTATAEGRIALLHALAHIELNAVDLALDIVGRFCAGLGEHREAFAADWLQVAAEEAKHFMMLSNRLKALGSSYGACEAHDGLWQAALASAGSLPDRLAIAPLTHEARGLDVTPGMIARLRSAGDAASAAILEVIYRDEIGHVQTGLRWFQHVCRQQGTSAEDEFPRALARVGLARPHAPFNEQARRQAGLSPPFDIAFTEAS
jgi:uncharacterized ferritin-like protein (DUF455 family)